MWHPICWLLVFWRQHGGSNWHCRSSSTQGKCQSDDRHGRTEWSWRRMRCNWVCVPDSRWALPLMLLDGPSLLGIWLLVTHFILTLTSTFYSDRSKTFSLFSRQLYLSRNGTSLRSTYYLETDMRSLPLSGSFAEFQQTFLIWKHFVWNIPIWPPQALAQNWGLRVARITSLWVFSTHENFTEGLGMLGKFYGSSEKPCWWLLQRPSLSLLFYETMYKYEAKPLQNIISFTS
jgi:hypothetical protein